MDLKPYNKFVTQTLKVATPVDISLYITALTHRSYINEHKKSASEHNERLEFLGDAVLELVVTRFLFSGYPDPEGVLTNWRSALVRTESIAAASERLELVDLIRMSRGEKNGTPRARQQILANTYEALIGAIYLDQGYDCAKDFIFESLIVTFDAILASGAWQDPKSKLQEVVQAMGESTPNYRVISEEGPDHEKNFTIGVYVGEKLLGTGSGPSKQIGQVGAAHSALQTLLAAKEK
jgi:ribonuclease III